MIYRRHLNLLKHERRCPLCFCFEDEKHFLLNCPVFAHLRNDLISTVEKTLKMNNLRRRNSDEIFGYLLANIEVAPIVAKYLSKTMELRFSRGKAKTPYIRAYPGYRLDSLYFLICCRYCWGINVCELSFCL